MSAIKWEALNSCSTETRAHVGGLRLRVWKPWAKASWQRWEWSIEGYGCRVLASGAAPTRKKARAMAEACAMAAQKAGLR